MIWLLGLVILLVLFVWPNYWVTSVLKKHSEPCEEIPGTGGELANHLKKVLKLEVEVSQTNQGDHFDPTAQKVCLSENNFNGRHLTAVATAAHEIGHAIQWQSNDAGLQRRGRWVGYSIIIQKIAQVSLILVPVLHLVPGGAILGKLLLIPVLLSVFFNTLVHIITLPVEWDASFHKALPILVQGQYIEDKDIQAVKRILRACAFTYLAAAVISLLNLTNLLRTIRR